ncbi:reverse transcriptase domain-containing protein [Rhodomicrobium sp.]|uniref:reverse transcriptase domain-containing protein n=1 Tax=Rhodomicrobium sp. TaxID=2720632 RepID=UPI0039E63482
MPPLYENCAYIYNNQKGKPIFVPTIEGRRIGLRIKSLIEQKYIPDTFYYHLSKGAHIAALHKHRDQKYFCRVDLENFFYSIARNRVQRCLRDIGVRRHESYSKWSCVKNPYGDPSYALPYGFVQSPLIASLVLHNSQLGRYLRFLPSSIVLSVYVDDITLSSNDFNLISECFHYVCDAVIGSNFRINKNKSTGPSEFIDLFNCSLTSTKTFVTQERKNIFYSLPKSENSAVAFESYCARVSHGNSE